MGEFQEVFYHRMRYFLTPQMEIYHNIRRQTDDGSDRGMVLDYGCGNGVGSVLLSRRQHEVVGVDSDHEAVAFADDCWGHLCTFKHGDWTHVGGMRYTNAFDTVVCLEVIEHVERPIDLLRELRSAIASKPNARAYISTLNHNSQYRKNRGHIGRFCVKEFREIVGRVFSGVRVYDYTLKNEITDDSQITPMVAVWGG